MRFPKEEYQWAYEHALKTPGLWVHCVTAGWIMTLLDDLEEAGFGEEVAREWQWKLDYPLPTFELCRWTKKLIDYYEVQEACQKQVSLGTSTAQSVEVTTSGQTSRKTKASAKAQ